MLESPDGQPKLYSIPQTLDKLKTSTELTPWETPKDGDAGALFPSSFSEQQAKRFHEIQQHSELSLIGYKPQCEAWATTEFWGRRDWLILGESNLCPGDRISDETSSTLQIVAEVLPFEAQANQVIEMAKKLALARNISLINSLIGERWTERDKILISFEKSKLLTYQKWELELSRLGLETRFTKFNSTELVKEKLICDGDYIGTLGPLRAGFLIE